MKVPPMNRCAYVIHDSRGGDLRCTRLSCHTGPCEHEPDGVPSPPAEPVPDWVFAAWIWDRREQYKPSSGTYEGLSQIIAGLCRGEHFEAWKHGELDDLREAIERCKRGG